ncbi:hypothetical protein OSB04_017161 [Centaurea solstitialis]|uniref:Aminotransferase class I/classII large domain-containing protein n=1 Tax=Centaurea solstitialis TaxID=347529 RepID=A0AA38WLS4_9ASTR|nr:hypothetical protein OSB04_017161 [Centaurea solstitialis]
MGGSNKMLEETLKLVYREDSDLIKDKRIATLPWRDGNVPQRTFHYYHPESKGLDFASPMDGVKNASNGSFFLLHACAHNLTGFDPTVEQWKEISYQFKVILLLRHLQGFASGDPERDAKSIRIFREDGHLIGCSQSYAKNMGLYSQRVGCLRSEWDCTTVLTSLVERLVLLSMKMGSPAMQQRQA